MKETNKVRSLIPFRRPAVDLGPDAQSGRDSLRLVPAGPGLMSYGIRSLFATVAILLLADLHSSYVAVSGKWETNPFIGALADTVGLHAALVAVKVVDLACLGFLYVLWKRWRANVAVCVVLLTSTFVYLQIVIDNYSR